jgi:succinate dehydrogenase/fumarate reductase flavoprotein subunit
MENEKIVINNFTIGYYCINTLIVGSGVASLNAAVNLDSMGQDDLVISTSEWGGGTSNNAGSDKQTYYKLSLSGSEPDSVSDMAHDQFAGKCMQDRCRFCF